MHVRVNSIQIMTSNVLVCTSYGQINVVYACTCTCSSFRVVYNVESRACTGIDSLQIVCNFVFPVLGLAFRQVGYNPVLMISTNNAVYSCYLGDRFVKVCS